MFEAQLSEAEGERHYDVIGEVPSGPANYLEKLKAKLFLKRKRRVAIIQCYMYIHLH